MKNVFKNKKVVIFIILGILLIIGVYFGINFFLTNQLNNGIEEITSASKTLILTEEEKKITNEYIEKLNSDITTKEKEKIIEEVESIIINIENTNKETLTTKENELKDLSNDLYVKEDDSNYNKLYNEYENLKKEKNYTEALTKVEEVIEYVSTEIKKAMKANQPDTMTNAIEISNLNYSIIDYEIIKLTGTYKNTTNYDFSKIVITYDVIGVGHTTAIGEGDCGDVVITINNVKSLGTGKVSYNDNMTKISCQYEYDKIKLQKIVAYK